MLLAQVGMRDHVTDRHLAGLQAVDGILGFLARVARPGGRRGTAANTTTRPRGQVPET